MDNANKIKSLISSSVAGQAQNSRALSSRRCKKGTPLTVTFMLHIAACMAVNWNKGTGMCDFYANKFTGVERYESSEPQNDVALMYRSCSNLDGKFITWER